MHNRMAKARRSLPEITDAVVVFHDNLAAVEPKQTEKAGSELLSEDSNETGATKDQ